MLLPPNVAVPYKFPSVPSANDSPYPGNAPSVPSKICRVVNAPAGVIWKTVPQPGNPEGHSPLKIRPAWSPRKNSR